MIPSGVWADVVDVYGDSAWIVRLAEMGLRSGSRVRVVQSGQPCLVEIGATRLSLRGEEMSQILVQPAESMT